MLNLTEEEEINKRLQWLKSINPEKSLFKGKSYTILKRIVDISVVLMSLPCWIPIIILIAVSIKISDPTAPVFFKQWRTGNNCGRFKFYKFRTMVPNAEELKAEYSHLNELESPDFKITNDPRITSIGRLLRKFSFDELPQLLNVLKGDMSLVGPRPTFITLDRFELWQTKRCDVMPGITGLWQIVGRGSTLFETRIRLDIAYVEKRCLWLDIQILFRTVTAILGRKGAY